MSHWAACSCHRLQPHLLTKDAFFPSKSYKGQRAPRLGPRTRLSPPPRYTHCKGGSPSVVCCGIKLLVPARSPSGGRERRQSPKT